MTRAFPMDQRRNGMDIVTWLRDHDEICPACEYQLRGVPEAVCPECGSELRLGVRAISLRMRWWIATIVVFAMAAGFNSVIATTMIVVSIVRGLPPVSVRGVMAVIFAGFVLGAGVCGAMLIWTVRRRARWLGMSREKQRIWALITFSTVFFVHAIFGAWVV
jgi:hypothetical protein